MNKTFLLRFQIYFKSSTGSLQFTVTLGTDFGTDPEYNLNTDSTITVTSGEDICTLTLGGASLTQDDVNNPNKITINSVTIPKEAPCDTMIVPATEVTFELPANLFTVEKLSTVESPEYSEEVTLL